VLFRTRRRSIRTSSLGSSSSWSAERRAQTVHRDVLRTVVRDRVERYELPGIGALNFVLHAALGGGVTRSLSLDPHGKSLSSCLLEMEIPDRQHRAETKP